MDPAVPPEQKNVLLVEDDSMVRQFIRRTLLDQVRITLLEAADGEEGLTLAQQWPGPLHLLITDLDLPKIAGPELAQRIVAARRETKVLFLSGYSEDLIIGRGILGPRSAFMQKPFDMTLLADKIRDLLAMN